MRFGLVGTGPWAELAHGPGLVAAEGVELVGVWGRSLSRADPLAQTLGVTAYDDYAALLADVEAVAFAVPPDVQAELALEAKLVFAREPINAGEVHALPLVVIVIPIPGGVFAEGVEA